MDKDYIIDFLSYEWIIVNLVSVLYLITVLFIGKKLNDDNRKKFAYLFVYFFIVVYTIYHFMHIIEDSWSIQKRLPLHLCGFSSLILCFILFIKRKQFWFEFLFYAGILGGINALMTPLIDHYTGTKFFYVEYFYSHTSIIIFPLYMYYYMDMKLTKYSWLKCFLALNILLIFIMPLDFLIDANYMYLKNPPNVNHPLVSGEWPYYLITFEFAALMLVYFTYALFKTKLLTNKK